MAKGVCASEPWPALIVQDDRFAATASVTVHRSNVHERIGRLPAHQLVEVERAVLTFLGLAG